MKAGTGKALKITELLIILAGIAAIAAFIYELKQPFLQTGNLLNGVMVLILAGIFLLLQKSRRRSSFPPPEEKIVKGNRLYSFISSINQMIVRVTDETTLFKEACRIAVDVGKFRMAWIGMLDEHTRQIIPVMHAGEEGQYLDTIKALAVDDVHEGRGATCIALKEGRYVACNDIEHDPEMESWAERALKHGYLSCIALPILKSGKVAGTFSLYAPLKDFFGPAEIALLEEAAADICFALEIFEKEALRRKAEEAVLESERRYQTLCEISPVGIFHTDADGYTTYVNPRWCQITGVPRDQALGNGWLEAVHKDDREALFAGWEEATKTHQQSVSEYRFVRPDGSIAWVMGQAIPEKNAENRVVGYVGTTTDITERKKSEEEIKREKYLSDSIINSLPCAFYLYTREGKFLRWNKYFEKVTMYSAEEISRMKPLDFFSPNKKALVSRAIENVFLYGEETLELEFRLKTGQKLLYYVTGKAIEYAGQPCLMGIGVDISERVEAQEKIKETSEQLRQLAAHLQEVREEERASMAREIHDELGQQLTGLKMDIYWMKEGLEPSDAPRQQQVEGILKLLDQTIYTVRKISAALRPFMLDDLGLVEALKAHGREFQNRFGIEVEFNTDLREIPVSSRVGISLFRIFQESLTNVARHADAKKICCSLTRSGSNIVLSIQDDGKGFDPEKTAGKRTLGLLGMKERILMMEGKFEIHSRPGAGTEIIVTVPLQAVTSINY